MFKIELYESYLDITQSIWQVQKLSEQLLKNMVWV